MPVNHLRVKFPNLRPRRVLFTRFGSHAVVRHVWLEWPRAGCIEAQTSFLIFWYDN